MNNVFSSFIELLRTHTDIVALMPNQYKGVQNVWIGQTEDDNNILPLITVRPENSTIIDPVNRERFFIVNCFDKDLVKAMYLADTICIKLDDCTETKKGVTMRITCSGLGSGIDPTTKEYNSPVSVRIVYKGD